MKGLILVAALLGASTASAEPRFEPVPQKTLVQAYPKAALGAHVSGAVVLVCRAEQRSPLDCRVKNETPAGYGFARAALNLAGRMKVVGGEGVFTTNIRFSLQDEQRQTVAPRTFIVRAQTR